MPKNSDDLFSLNREALASAKIDPKARTIEGYVVIQKGELLDCRNYMIDNETMNQVAALGNGSEQGIKVRWTHPSWSEDHLGKYLGRASNFRVDGDVVRADIKFSNAAELSPVFDRDPVAYILALAEEDPSAFATSIYFMRDGKAMAVMASLLDEDDPIPMRIAELYASDIVDEGAAATSFFSKQKPSLSPCGDGATDEKEKQMADEAKKAEEAQALAVEESKKADATRLDALKAEFKDDPDFVLDQYSKGNDITQAKAEWADVLADQLAKSKKENEELKAKKPDTKIDGEDPIGFTGENDADGSATKFDARVEKHMASGLSRADAIAKASKEDPDGFIL